MRGLFQPGTLHGVFFDSWPGWFFHLGRWGRTGRCLHRSPTGLQLGSRRPPDGSAAFVRRSLTRKHFFAPLAGRFGGRRDPCMGFPSMDFGTRHRRACMSSFLGSLDHRMRAVCAAGGFFLGCAHGRYERQTEQHCGQKTPQVPIHAIPRHSQHPVHGLHIRRLHHQCIPLGRRCGRQ